MNSIIMNAIRNTDLKTIRGIYYDGLLMPLFCESITDSKNRMLINIVEYIHTLSLSIKSDSL